MRKKLSVLCTTFLLPLLMTVPTFAADSSFSDVAPDAPYGRVQKLHPPILFAETLISCHRHRDLWFCVQLIVLQGHTATEVSEKLGITKQAVNQCKNRALKKLRNRL